MHPAVLGLTDIRQSEGQVQVRPLRPIFRGCDPLELRRPMASPARQSGVQSSSSASRRHPDVCPPPLAADWKAAKCMYNALYNEFHRHRPTCIVRMRTKQGSSSEAYTVSEEVGGNALWW
mmetsp:Transcript_54322/g.175639  ORF Transcript_54322/g.175639 Transcript_54322/m.175639 type:complete len:120 (+) Transcript_54322:854-1213(+)